MDRKIVAGVLVVGRIGCQMFPPNTRTTVLTISDLAELHGTGSSGLLGIQNVKKLLHIYPMPALTGLSGTGRYVRMYGTVRGTQWGYSLWEFQIFPALSPELSIALSGTNVVLSWPMVSGNTWSLQTAPTLGLPVSWSNLTTAPFLLNSEYLLTNEVSAPVQFYRLEQGP
jgi:hypothetical protein